jgi:hypothetical protein
LPGGRFDPVEAFAQAPFQEAQLVAHGGGVSLLLP